MLSGLESKDRQSPLGASSIQPTSIQLNSLLAPSGVLPGLADPLNQISSRSSSSYSEAIAANQPPATLPLNLIDGGNYLWDIQQNGNIIDGTSDAYDGGMSLNGFPNFATGTTEDNGREIVIGAATINGASVTRKIYIPTDQAFARFLEIVTNPGSSILNYTVDLNTNLGSDSGTLVVRTSNGDTNFTTADNWIVTDDGDSIFDPTMLHVIAGEGALRPTSVSSPIGFLNYGYNLSLNPGETKIVMHFGAQNPNQATALTKGNQLTQLGLNALVGMSAQEKELVVNFNATNGQTDGQTVSIQSTDANALEVVNGQSANPGQFTFTRQGSTNTALTVNYTIGGSATNGTDYSNITNSIVIPVGQTSVTLPINVINDRSVEGNETALLTLSASNAYTIGTSNTATITLADNDISGNQTVTGTLSNTDPNNPTRTGRYRDDYELTGLTVGETVRINLNAEFDPYLQLVNESTGEVIAFDDDSGEGFNSQLSFIVQDGPKYLVRATSYSSGATGNYSLITTTLPTVSIQPTDANALEVVNGQPANPGQFTFTRQGSTATALTVNYTLGGSATNGTDYSNITNSIVIPVGQTSVTLPINVINDRSVEGNETLSLSLATSSAYGIGSANAATVTIGDNDISGNQTISGTLSNTDPNNPARTGSYRDDYELTGLTVGETIRINLNGSFDPYLQLVNESTGEVIAYNDDSGGSLNSQLSFTVQDGINYLVRATSFNSGATGNYSLITTTLPTVTIQSTDANALEVVNGETANPGQFTITRTGSTTNALTVNYTLGGSATNGTDYSNITNSIVIPVGQTSVTLPINVINDRSVEGDETVSLSLATSSAYGIGSANAATVTIGDNDISGNQTISGTLSNTDSDNPTQTGRFRDDYQLSGVTVGETILINLNAEFDAYLQLVNESTGEAIAADNDSGGGTNSYLRFTVEEGISYAVRATSFNSGATGNYSLTTSTLPTLNISATDPNAIETLDGQTSNPGEFRISRSGSTANALTVNYTVGGSATNGTDYSNLTNSIVIPVGASSVTLPIGVMYDSIAEGNETVVLNLAADNGYSLGTTTSAIVNIADYDPIFNNFSLVDASGDNTFNTIFEGGATRFSYNLANTLSLSNVRLEALSNGSVVSTLGTWSEASLSNALLNLGNFSSLTGGNYQLRAVARTTSGQEFFSSSQSLSILSWNQSSNTSYGTFAGETLNYSAALGTGNVFVGRGGTDTLNLLGISRSSVTSINGIGLTSFNPLSSTANQAIFRGTAFDYLTLADGREIYFQGIENLRFIDEATLDLQVRTNDNYFPAQWNLHVSDVDSAWRFTQGASDVLLSSVDSGVLTAVGNTGNVVDISTNRLITDSTDDDNYNPAGHGHQSISIMASTANNGSGVAGINWNSNVYVNDVYNGVSLQQAISDAIAYARANNQRLVFQGGIQGEYWLNDGGTQAELEQLIEDNSDIALFAIAAGNGGVDIDNTTSDPVLSGGVARLQTTHSNVMSVGALERGGASTVNGLSNATSVNRAYYSNYGSSLTLMAATDSPAMEPDGSVNMTFNGTSAANPNMAGIASLVWSVNSELTGGELRQILIDTAMDLGTEGRDNTFGNGLANADAAVRRAVALSRNNQLANLYTGRSEFA
ncbi:S8 family serine peptidase [Microcoleus sp. FACHB-831]|uniref:beta strand repeat-containing protein n=1 Tax=Microcoleus sp. FACHB-831 TaxID=2692827 RepID=UPI00168A3827|nr:Calx-beta domain-containing protein [Microcoleus sp. FACHB-831]MBD1923771.1 S8 family serine peptidase [Microcoleus sp. FACHB-831]